MCKSGIGVKADMSAAIKWLQKASDNGSKEAKEVLLRCQNDNADYQFSMGKKYYEGEGVDKDVSKAIEWLRMAAENGHGRAQYVLGLAYFIGQGVEKNPTTGTMWLRKAAENGNAEAQFQLGKNYFNGENVDKDEAKAALWIRKAAENGIAEAQYVFGMMCENGVGVGADHVEAIKWFSKASEQGHEEAKNTLAAYRAKLAGAARNETNELQGCRSSEHGDFEDGVRQGAQLLSLLLNLREAQRQNEQVYNPITGHYMKRSEYEQYKQIYNDQRIREQSRDDYRSGFPIPIFN